MPILDGTTQGVTGRQRLYWYSARHDGDMPTVEGALAAAKSITASRPWIGIDFEKPFPTFDQFIAVRDVFHEACPGSKVGIYAAIDNSDSGAEFVRLATPKFAPIAPGETEASYLARVDRVHGMKNGLVLSHEARVRNDDRRDVVLASDFAMVAYYPTAEDTAETMAHTFAARLDEGYRVACGLPLMALLGGRPGFDNVATVRAWRHPEAAAIRDVGEAKRIDLWGVWDSSATKAQLDVLLKPIAAQKESVR
jgi:hypothetical protein